MMHAYPTRSTATPQYHATVQFDEEVAEIAPNQATEETGISHSPGQACGKIIDMALEKSQGMSGAGGLRAMLWSCKSRCEEVAQIEKELQRHQNLAAASCRADDKLTPVLADLESRLSHLPASMARELLAMLRESQCAEAARIVQELQQQPDLRIEDLRTDAAGYLKARLCIVKPALLASMEQVLSSTLEKMECLDRVTIVDVAAWIMSVSMCVAAMALAAYVSIPGGIALGVWGLSIGICEGIPMVLRRRDKIALQEILNCVAHFDDAAKHIGRIPVQETRAVDRIIENTAANISSPSQSSAFSTDMCALLKTPGFLDLLDHADIISVFSVNKKTLSTLDRENGIHLLFLSIYKINSRNDSILQFHERLDMINFINYRAIFSENEKSIIFSDFVFKLCFFGHRQHSVSDFPFLGTKFQTDIQQRFDLFFRLLHAMPDESSLHGLVCDRLAYELSNFSIHYAPRDIGLAFQAGAIKYLYGILQDSTRAALHRRVRPLVSACLKYTATPALLEKIVGRAIPRQIVKKHMLPAVTSSPEGALRFLSFHLPRAAEPMPDPS